MRLTGNKGEWSELYAFIKLLSMGRLYAADENANRMQNVFLPIIKILRGSNGEALEYIIGSEDGTVEIHWRAREVQQIKRSVLVGMAACLYGRIMEGGNGAAFSIEEAEDIMRELRCDRIAAPSTDKTDIRMEVHNVYTGCNAVCGFSIKSELGSPPTLLNASKATNFVYEITGLTEAQAEEVNAISTATKIIDRIQKVYSLGNMQYRCTENGNFRGNLLLLDTNMDRILGEMLLDYYKSNVADCRTLAARMEEKDPLGYQRKGVYTYKFRKFLSAVALGMKPSKEWDGRDEANGGYVIVKRDGDVVAYHLYNRDSFESYLLSHTRFERASTTRHGFASVYKEEDGKMYMKLNLQIRFI